MGFRKGDFLWAKVETNPVIKTHHKQSDILKEKYCCLETLATALKGRKYSLGKEQSDGWIYCTGWTGGCWLAHRILIHKWSEGICIATEKLLGIQGLPSLQFFSSPREPSVTVTEDADQLSSSALKNRPVGLFLWRADSSTHRMKENCDFGTCKPYLADTQAAIPRNWDENKFHLNAQFLPTSKQMY